MKEIEDIVNDIRSKLKDNAYQKEEHVRLAIIARLCQALGWDIWNPEEFYTEYSIKLKSKEGSVDVALFNSLVKDKTPAVFFEAKMVGKLNGNIRDSEYQLMEYNQNNAALITILTDGRKWRFYLSTAPGTFSQRMFSSFDLEDDDISYIIGIFRDVLSKNRFTNEAVSAAGKLLSDLKISKEIDRAKQEALKRGNEFPDLNMYQIVQLIMKEHGHDVSLDEIKRLWDIKKTGTDDPPPPPPPPPPIDYTGTSPLRVYIIDKWFDLNPVSKRLDWSDVKFLVFNYILEKGKKITLDGRKGVFTQIDPKRKQSTKSIGDGHFIDTGFNANTIVKHCCEALASAGYNSEVYLRIELKQLSLTGVLDAK
ncbi:MAG: type I restriction enzyme HsdR N-terminal domain-containing protein [Candidatus Cloacimonetes bacterium]|nr:type I restriction enzyme HsdR N-terminal domain-containing protein [Candidatus Cloacimonadota bacterium]